MRKRSLFLGLILLVLGLGLGYAFLTTTLNISGTADVDSNTWNVYWDNVVVTEGSVSASTPVIDSNKTTVTFSVHLSKPGDFYEFTVDAKNDGSIDAMIDTITKTTNIPSYLNYAVTYEDNYPIVDKQLLKSHQKEVYKVKVEYRTDINSSDLPSTASSINLTFGISYLQSDSSAIRVRNYRYFRRLNYSYRLEDSIPDLYHNQGAFYSQGCYDDLDGFASLSSFIRYTYDDNEIITNLAVGLSVSENQLIYLYPGEEQYDRNVSTITEAFSEGTCEAIGTTGMQCYINNQGGYFPYVKVYQNGSISAQNDCLDCQIRDTGYSSCSLVHTTECYG